MARCNWKQSFRDYEAFLSKAKWQGKGDLGTYPYSEGTLGGGHYRGCECCKKARNFCLGPMWP